MKARKARRPLELLLTLVVILSVFFYRSPAALAVDIDAAYPAANITGYILSTSNKTAVAYASIGGPSVGHIYANDDCTIQAVYTNGWVKVSVPWSGYPNGRVVYTERSNFINSVAYTPWPLKAPVKTAAYSRLDLSQRLGYVYAGDNCYVVNEVGDYYQILCPWTGGVYRLCWANKIDFGGGPAPASAECTGYVSTSSLPLTLRQSASTNAKILANMPKGSSVVVLDNKAVTNGFYHVKYGSFTGYASTTYISFTAPNPNQSSSLIWPTAGKYVTCLYYYASGAKHSSRYGNTYSIDISGGGNVYAAAAGKVETATYQSGGFGNYIVILHDDGSKTLYGHLKSYSVRVGQHVNQGQTIGIMGSTGNSSGVHLHFEWSGGDPWNTYFKSDTSLIYQQNVRSNNAKYNSDKTIVNHIDANYRYSNGWYYRK